MSEGSSQDGLIGGGAAWVRDGLARAFLFVLRHFVSLSVVLVTGVLSTAIYVYASGPERFKVFLVGAQNGRDSIAGQISEGFLDACGPSLSIRGVPIEFEVANDLGSEQIAVEVASDLADRDDVVMVIGHVFSTPTRRALPSYLGADPPIPVILPTETSPKVLPPGTRRDAFLPVYRLAPSDDDQAQAIVDHALVQQAQNVWVIEDSNNQVYSEYLGKRVAEQLWFSGHRVKLRTRSVSQLERTVDPRNGASRPVPDWRGWLARRLLGFAHRLEPPPVPRSDVYEKFVSKEILRDHRVDGVVYVGDVSGARQAIHQFRTLAEEPDGVVILTDLAADRKLLDHADVLERVYLTHPMRASAFLQNGYRLQGHDACQILKALVADVNKGVGRSGGRLAGLKERLRIVSVEDARRAIFDAMEGRAFSRKPFPGVRLGGGGYHVDHRGRRSNARFHVWTVRDGRFSDVPPSPLHAVERSAEPCPTAKRAPERGLQVVLPCSRRQAATPVVFSERVRLRWRRPEGLEFDHAYWLAWWPEDEKDRLGAKGSFGERIIYGEEYLVDDLPPGRYHWSVTPRCLLVEDPDDPGCHAQLEETVHGSFERWDDSLQRMAELGEIRVGILKTEDGSFLDLSRPDPAGFDIDLVHELNRRMFPAGAVKPRFYGYSFVDLLKAVTFNEVDLAVGRITRLPEREDRYVLRFSEPYYQTEQVLVVRRGAGVTRFEDLTGIRIAYAADTTSERLVEALHAMQAGGRGALAEEPARRFVQPVATSTDAMELVLNGTVVGAVMDAVIAHDLRRTSGRSSELELIEIEDARFEEQPRIFHREQYAIAVGKHDEGLLATVNEALAAIRTRDGHAGSRLVALLEAAGIPVEGAISDGLPAVSER